MTEFKDVWVKIEEAATILKCSSKDIEVLINGMTMFAIIQNGGKLVNLKGIGDFLEKVQIISSQLLIPSTPFGSQKKMTWIKGKKAAEIISISYNVFEKMCEDKKIGAERRGRGWRIEKTKLDDFIKSNQGLKNSLNVANPDPPKFPTGSSPVITPDPPKPPVEPSPIIDVPPVVPAEENHLPEITKEENSEEDDSPENIENNAPVKHTYTIRGRKFNHGFLCRIDDVAITLKRPEIFIKEQWIKKNLIIATEAPGNSGITYYINQESLRKFLKTYNIDISFDNH